LCEFLIKEGKNGRNIRRLLRKLPIKIHKLKLLFCGQHLCISCWEGQDPASHEEAETVP